MLKSKNGITLIALVVTIVLLLILSGITINLVFSDNGIIAKAREAKTETSYAQVKEEMRIGQYTSYINRTTGDNAKVGELVTGGNKPYTNNGTAVIPEGFMIVPGCEDVSKGLVISDSLNDIEDGNTTIKEGNQFVWIPVTSENQYKRNRQYENEDVSAMAYTDIGYLPNVIQPSIDDSINNEKEERKDVLNVGGFYIARYEAGKDETNNLVSKFGATVWNDISQEDCKEISKLFIDNGNVKSALCSGIQWDVAMDFITKNDETYNATITNDDRHTDSLAKSGQNEIDKGCNIYDLEGNCREYVSEKSSFMENREFVNRGGFYGNIISASSRTSNTGIGASLFSFRFVLYVM